MLAIIIQHIVTLPKYGHAALNIRRSCAIDILRYTQLRVSGRKIAK